MTRHVVGLDVGGANLKAASFSGEAWSEPFELWKRPGDLPAALQAVFTHFPPTDRLAVTMTGELCDCFATRREGVLAILDSVQVAAGSKTVRVWLADGRFTSVDQARRSPLLAAAANWLALATFAGRFASHGPALLVDVGSTTTDLVPLLDCRPVAAARQDPDRLRSGELVYTGSRRTPVCALLDGFGAAEFFATTHDVYVLLGDVPEDPHDCGTADGRPATREWAHARLARLFCGDAETVAEVDTLHLAHRVYERQLEQIRSGLERVSQRLPAPPRTFLISGSGEFLARRALEAFVGPEANVISLTERLGPAISAAACAYAVAVLAAEETGRE